MKCVVFLYTKQKQKKTFKHHSLSLVVVDLQFKKLKIQAQNPPNTQPATPNHRSDLQMWVWYRKSLKFCKFTKFIFPGVSENFDQKNASPQETCTDQYSRDGWDDSRQQETKNLQQLTIFKAIVGCRVQVQHKSTPRLVQTIYIRRGSITTGTWGYGAVLRGHQTRTWEHRNALHSLQDEC